MKIPTKITVRVIARDGKFLGGDIGGALVTIRDAQTKELLVEGITNGGSGENGAAGVMCVRLRRGEALPTKGASSFETDLLLDLPKRIEVTAYGPLGARQSANTVSATQWVYPGKDVTGGDGFLLELPDRADHSSSYPQRAGVASAASDPRKRGYDVRLARAWNTSPEKCFLSMGRVGR